MTFHVITFSGIYPCKIDDRRKKPPGHENHADLTRTDAGIIANGAGAALTAEGVFTSRPVPIHCSYPLIDLFHKRIKAGKKVEMLYAPSVPKEELASGKGTFVPSDEHPLDWFLFVDDDDGNEDGRDAQFAKDRFQGKMDAEIMYDALEAKKTIREDEPVKIVVEEWSVSEDSIRNQALSPEDRVEITVTFKDKATKLAS